MKLNYYEAEIYKELVISIVRILGITQGELAKQVGVSPVEFSKVKSCLHLGDRRFEKLLAGLENVISGFEEDARENLEQLIDKLRRSIARGGHRDLLSSVDEGGEFGNSCWMWRVGYAETCQQILPLPMETFWTITSAYREDILKNFYAGVVEKLEEMSSGGNSHLACLRKVKNYRHVLSPVFAMSVPVIQLFPFFLTLDRRALWGVVPYGFQRRLGIVAPKSVISQSWFKDEDWPVLHPCHFVEMLERGVVLHNVMPYSGQQILCEMMMRHFGSNHLMSFHRACAPEWVSFEEAVLALGHIGGWAGLNTNVLVYDLAEREVVSQLLERQGLLDFVRCEIEHRVEVPVGIGYSLQALPWLAEKDRFNALQHFVQSLLGSARDDFSSIGIELS